jgi:hypothetical protein
MPQIGAAQASVIQVRALQICVAEIRLAKIGAPQRKALQLGMRKVSFFTAFPIGVQPGTVVCENPLQLVERQLPNDRVHLRTIS